MVSFWFVKSWSLGEDEDMITLVLVKYGGKNIKIKLLLKNIISISRLLLKDV